MTAPNTKPAPAAVERRRRPAKVIFEGVEILRPAVPPSIPLWRLRRAAKIAMKQHADEFAKSK